MTIIKASTRARISRGIFSFVATRLLPVVARHHHRSLDAIQAQQDQVLKDARQATIAALQVYLDTRDEADALANRRAHVMIGVAHERDRINTYIKED